MPAIHLIEKKNLITPVPESKTEYESGYWKISTSQAGKLVGGEIYFHKRQIGPSHNGGIIVGFRIQQEDPYKGRVVFRFKAGPEFLGVRTGNDGWQVEQKIVR